MKDSSTNTSKVNKKEFTSTVIGTVLIGILTNALWEKIISPLFTHIFDIILNLSNDISVSFSNLIYSAVSYGYSNDYSRELFTLLILILFIIFLSESGYKDKIRKFRVPLLFIAIVFLQFLLAKHSYINSKSNIVQKSIEVVSPYISDIEYKTLKADFYSIKNKNDYDSLIHILNEIGIKNNLRLSLPIE